MKKYFFIIASIILAGLIITACSKDDNPTDTDIDTGNLNQYFPYSVGSTANFKGYSLDDNGDIIDSTIYYYKVSVKSKQTIQNREALIFEYKTMDDKIFSKDNVYSTTSSQIFQNFKLLPQLDVDLPIDIPEAWYKIYDDNENRWDLFSYYFDNQQVQFGNMQITLLDTFKIYVTNDGTENITWGDNLEFSGTAKVFTMNYEYLGKAKIEGIPIPIQIPFTGKYHYYYVKNIGLVKTEFENLSVEFSGLQQTLSRGFGTVLTSYNHP